MGWEWRSHPEAQIAAFKDPAKINSLLRIEHWVVVAESVAIDSF